MTVRELMAQLRHIRPGYEVRTQLGQVSREINIVTVDTERGRVVLGKSNEIG